jgi:chromate reductase, NAD(P)H dehydrogenase (quinone)
VNILALCGSLRAVSSNKTLLRAAARLAPEGVAVTLYEGLGDLPHYNPDLEPNPPEVVIAFRKLVRDAAGLLIASPEYMHGVPGAMKNALDWLVGGGDEFVGKRVALLNASPRATRAQESLKDTITLMAGHVVEEASIGVLLLGKNMSEDDILEDAAIAASLRAAIKALVRAIEGASDVAGPGARLL